MGMDYINQLTFSIHQADLAFKSSGDMLLYIVQLKRIHQYHQLLRSHGHVRQAHRLPAYAVGLCPPFRMRLAWLEARRFSFRLGLKNDETRTKRQFYANRPTSTPWFISA